MSRFSVLFKTTVQKEIHKRAEENMTIPNTDVTGGQGGTKERLGVGVWQAAV